MGYFKNLHTERLENDDNMDDFLFYVHAQEKGVLKTYNRINRLRRITKKSKKRLKFFSKNPITKMNLNTMETK